MPMEKIVRRGGAARERHPVSIGARVGLCTAVVVTTVAVVTTFTLIAERTVTDGAFGIVDDGRSRAIPLLQTAEQANQVAWILPTIDIDDPDDPDRAELADAIVATDQRVAALEETGFELAASEREFASGRSRWHAAQALMAETGAEPLTRIEQLGVAQRLFPLLQGAVDDWTEAHAIEMESLAARLEVVQEQRNRALRLSLAVALFGVMVTLAIGQHLTRTVVRPTQRLRSATSRLATGNHDPVEVGGPSELAALGDDFNAMGRQLREREAALVHRAMHDPLTGFGNRMMLADRLNHALARRVRHPHEQVTVLVLDLDGFKRLNDTLGHAVGDDALRIVGKRLARALREDDTLTRLGGDEFAVVIRGDADVGAATAEGLCACLREPVSIAGRTIRLTASIGVATTAERESPGSTSTGDASSDDLLRDADLAMYAAKHRGGDTVERFTRRLHEEAEERLRIEEDLRKGLAAGEIEVHYQPVVDATDGSVFAVEALARWRHPKDGFIEPDRFIAVAEVTGLVVPLGWEVISQAVGEAARWPATGDAPGPALSINLSPRQLQEPDVVDRLLATLHGAGLAPTRLIVEITETTTLEQVVDASAELARLRAAGVRIALDDFGTGYTSLRYLQGTPVDLLKIDRSFVDGVAERRDQQSLVRTLVDLAADLGYAVVAEGVERTADLELLTRMGCTLVQGFVCARPVPSTELHRVLSQPAQSLVAAYSITRSTT
jgi:diguanylate cyclase (GGDEF)-like protein